VNSVAVRHMMDTWLVCVCVVEQRVNIVVVRHMMDTWLMVL